jgi:hypothetical protein
MGNDMTLRRLCLLAGLLLVLALPSAGLAGIEGDLDADTVPDGADNCPTVGNPLQSDTDADGAGDLCDNCALAFQTPVRFCDVDADGYGNLCDCDFENDLMCDMLDLAIFADNFALPGNAITDMNCDGVTQMGDFGRFANGFGGVPGPSGLACAGLPPCQP